MRRSDPPIGSIALLFVVVCCVTGVVFAAPVSGQPSVFAQSVDQPEPDNTITRINLAADGSATWEITLRTRLENDSQVAEYEQFQDRFRSNTSRYLDPFADRMTGVVAAANDSAERDMRATHFEAETAIQEVPRRWGVVTFRFSWTGFAAVGDDAVVVGDVFDGGFFINDDDALSIAAPDGYTIVDAAPTPDDLDDGAAEWQGREDFADGRPSVRAVPAPILDDGDENTADGGGEGSGSESGSGGGSVTDNALIGVGLLMLLIIGPLVVVAYGVRSGRIRLGGDDGLSSAAGSAGHDTDTGDQGNGGSPTAVPPAHSDEQTMDSGENGLAESDISDDMEGSNEPGEPAVAGGSGGIDPEMLTDEDHVKRVLREAGGRLKQSDVADTLGWSKSKTSRVLSRMADEGEVEKLRIGRENVIDLVHDES